MKENGGKAFPNRGDNTDSWGDYDGMDLMQYAEIHFTSAWIQALGLSVFQKASETLDAKATSDFMDAVAVMGKNQAKIFVESYEEGGDG